MTEQMLADPGKSVPAIGATSPAALAHSSELPEVERARIAVTTRLAALISAVWMVVAHLNMGDWHAEAAACAIALLHGDLADFLRLAPPYAGSLLLRAPFIELARLWHGRGTSVYLASAVPCLAAAIVLGAWLDRRVTRQGAGPLAGALTFAVCVANPFALTALDQGHAEDLLGAVLCVAAVVCAQRDRALWCGLLVGLAIANKPWGVLAAGPALVALDRDRWRALAVAGLSAGAVLAPFILVHSSSFLRNTQAVGLSSGSIFNPEQVWWWVGPVPWVQRLGHTLPLACMVPITLGVALRHRHAPRRRRENALLLLALLLLLRCALDPWDNVYYAAPFITALLAWEVTTHRRPPLLTVGTAIVTWVLFGDPTWLLLGSPPGLLGGPDVLGTDFLAATVIACLAIGWTLLTGDSGARRVNRS